MKKIDYINVLRCMACILVVIIHVIDGWLIIKPDITGFRRIFDCILIQPFIRIAVAIFIMISGTLLLNPNKNVDIYKIRKYIKKMVLILVTFGLFYCFIEVVYNLGVSNIWLVIKTSIKNLFQEKSWGHLWYVYMLIGLYIITPILRAFVKDADKKTVKFVLTALFLVSVVVPTINEIFKLQITSFRLNSLVYVFIYLLGYYIGNTDYISKKIAYISGIIGLCGYLLVSYYFGINSQNNLFVILEATFIFYVFSRSYVKSNKFIDLVSENSLAIYIIHTFWLNLFNKGLNIYPDILPVFLGEILFFCIAFGLSLMSGIIIHKIPVIKDIV